MSQKPSNPWQKLNLGKSQVKQQASKLKDHFHRQKHIIITCTYQSQKQGETRSKDVVTYKQCIEKKFLKNMEIYHKLPKCITVMSHCTGKDPVALFNE